MVAIRAFRSPKRFRVAEVVPKRSELRDFGPREEWTADGRERNQREKETTVIGSPGRRVSANSGAYVETRRGTPAA